MERMIALYFNIVTKFLRRYKQILQSLSNNCQLITLGTTYFCPMKVLVFLSVLIFVSCGSDETRQNTLTQPPKTLPAYAEKWLSEVGTSADSNLLQLQLAQAYDSIGNYTTALKYIQKLLVKDSGNYGLWYTKAQYSERAGDTVTAIDDYLHAAELYPSADALLGAGNLFAETKNEKALRVSTEILKMRLGSRTDAHAHFIAGVYYARTGNTENAVTALENCIANNYTYMEAYIEKGLLYFDAKNYTKALEVFNFASTVNTLYADNYYYIARCYEMMEKKDSAIAKFEQALSLDANMVEAKQALQRLNK
ncbi:MAG: hypothetical protein EAZ47_10395 [Bacteroidetes bacterium]|nr:MAG: hypothetical protein EAY72_12420 [Bacteroidota bacterium]TAF91073.1 MAG: hypothetical protein EAZ47_10395 [Bacteroidota bacterium]